MIILVIIITHIKLYQYGTQAPQLWEGITYIREDGIKQNSKLKGNMIQFWA